MHSYPAGNIVSSSAGNSASRSEMVIELDDIEIIDARLLLGMTRKEFAQQVGVSYRAVVKWERGERKANGAAVKTIQRLVEEVENGKAS